MKVSVLYLALIATLYVGSVNSDVCGNSVYESSTETCDDGNTAASDGCSATCTVESTYFCSHTTSPDTCVVPTCGNSKVEGEGCDDGNTSNNDGCSSTCTIETGYSCSGGSFTSASSCSEICGDGLDMKAYNCDDGNTVSGDGCTVHLVQLKQGIHVLVEHHHRLIHALLFAEIAKE